MANFKSLDDIEREKSIKERENRRQRISTDINRVFNDVMKKREEESRKNKKKLSWHKKIILALISLA